MQTVNIKSIELQNYRQFKDTKVDFSQDRKKPFTIIEGKNGFGKSNLLNALTWCFYGIEEHLKHAKDEEAESIINSKVINALKDGERANAKVIVKLSTNKGDIMIEREVFGRRSGGTFYLDEDTDFQILEQNERGDWNKSIYPTYIINRILPQIVMRFFFFDGEQLRQFFENISQQDVKDAIFDISQVSLIDFSINSLNKVLSDYRAEDKSDDPRLNKLNEDIEFYKDNIKNLPIQIKDLETQNQNAKKNIQRIDTELKSSSIDVIKQQQELRDSTQKEYDQTLKDIEELEEEFGNYAISRSPLILSKGAITQTLEILSKLSMEGILPPKIEDTFIRELLEIKKECICGTDLKDGKARQKLITMLEERKLKEGVAKEANELKYELNPLKKQIDEFNERSRIFVNRLRGLNERLKEKNGKLNEISTKLKKYGELSQEDLLNKERERENLDEAIKDNIEKIARFQVKLDDYVRILKGLEDDYDSLSKEIIKNKRLIQKKAFIKNGISTLEYIKNKLINELRVEIEKNTKGYFTKMVTAKTFDEISITEDYKIKIVKGGQPALKSLSVGETLLLGLSFMASLRKVSGFIAPVVIDTPLAPIDKDYRDNLIDFMSTALEDTQIILLVKDTEYTESVKGRLRSKTGAKKLLEHDKNTGFTEVVNYD
jgi:DNA sulfur modification protein DndD